MEFSDPVFREVYQHFHEQLKKGIVPDSQYLIEHGSKEVKDLVNQMLWSSDLADSHSLRSFSDVATNAILAAEVPPQLDATTRSREALRSRERGER